MPEVEGASGENQPVQCITPMSEMPFAHWHGTTRVLAAIFAKYQRTGGQRVLFLAVASVAHVAAGST